MLVPGLVFAGPIAIALTAAGAVGIAGGLIGALKDWGIPQDRVRDYESAVRNGAILIGVKHDRTRMRKSSSSSGAPRAVAEVNPCGS